MIYDEIHKELTRANDLFPPFKSFHESYAVILEEVDEYWDEVKKKQPDRDNMKKELIQICAMCVRAIQDLKL